MMFTLHLSKTALRLHVCALALLTASGCILPDGTSPTGETPRTGAGAGGGGGSGTPAPSLNNNPRTVTIASEDTMTFFPTGGTAPYTFSILFGLGDVDDTGGFTAPTAPVQLSTIVRVTDSAGASSDSVVTINPELEISPATLTWAVNGIYTFTATGGVTPYTYSVNTGSGSINASTGAFTAAATPGAVTVRVTDALGHYSDSTVTINSAVSVSPSSKSLAVNNTFTFTASNGATPYTYSIVSGGGTINASSGLYTAPATSGVATVRVTDAAGGVSDSSVTINAALAISPTSYTLAVNNTHTFSASGGVAPYSYSIQSGTGSVHPTSGLYTAPASAGSAVILVTDSLSNTATANVTITGALAISPATLTWAVNRPYTFSASGGVPPYVFSVFAGGGSINSSSGAFTAGATAGAVTVRVTDAVSNTSDSSVTVNNAVAISPTTYTLAAGNTHTFTASNGVAPYTYTIISGFGTIHPSTGLYSAPASAGSNVVRVTDTTGGTSDATITINAALAISPTSVSLSVGNTHTFSASGGVAPYAYSIQSGTGSVDPASGLYTAPGSAGSAVVKVTDALSNTTTANVTVAAGIVISPSTLTWAVNQNYTFTATGGVAPYTYSIQAGLGSIGAATGIFTAGASAGAVTVRVTDSIANYSESTVTVNAAVSISPTTKTLAVNNNFTFTGSDGATPLVYTVVSGGGAINPSTGAYTAPATSGSATVRVTDTAGVYADSLVTINPAISLSPTSLSIAVNGTQTFAASGGVAPYTYSIDSGVGSIHATSGLYTAPASTGSAVVRVTDTLSNTTTANVSVTAALAITPATKTLAVTNNFTFGATGGTAPYSYSIISGGGSVGAATGVYTAPGSAGSATVRVTDAVSATSDAAVTINAALAISPTSFALSVGNTTTFSATGGVAPYGYTIDSGVGSVDPASGLYTAPGSPGSAVVKVTDSLGNTSTANVTVGAGIVISPSTLTWAVNQNYTFTATGGVAPYTYSIQSGLGSIGAATGVFTAGASAGAVTVRVTDSLSNFSESTVTVNAAVAISPTTKSLAVNNAFTFTGSNGAPPLVYTVESGGGSINSSSGAYTAPSAAGSATIRVTDAAGVYAESLVTVNGALSISPAIQSLAINNTVTFAGVSGVPPYGYTIDSGVGSVDPTSGLYTAPGSAGAAVVKVTDSLGNISTADVTVTAALAISPTTKTLAVNNVFTFSATGGATPYTYSVVSGGGSVVAGTGAYTAPASAVASVTLRVTDALNNTSDATITVNPALAISPTSWTMNTSATKTFGATGGVSTYTYSIESGGGSINSSNGLYTAPGTADSVVVKVTDTLGNTSTASVTVRVPLAIAPATAVGIRANQVYGTNFSATGGTAPYTYSVFAGGGSINSSTGQYTAPSTIQNVTIRVTDNDGTTSDNNLVYIIGSPALWLDAEQGVTCSGGGTAVSTWSDQSGNGYDASQGTANERPTCFTSQVTGSGNSAVTFSHTTGFDGTYDNLNLGANYLFSNNSGVTLFSVMNSVANMTNPYFFSFGNAVTTHYGFGYDTAGAGIATPTSFSGVDQLTSGNNVAHAYGSGTWVTYTGEITFGASGSQKVRLNGGSTLINQAITTSALTATEIAEASTRGTFSGPVTIGMRSDTGADTTSNLRGGIAEMLFYDDTVSTAERTTIEAYLRAKHQHY